MIMQAISYTSARSHFAKMMKQVCQDHVPIIVTRQKAESVIMMSLGDYESLIETVYLLRNPKNAARLIKSIRDIESGKCQEKGLLEE